MNHYYIVYDKHNNDLPIGQFDLAAEIAEYFDMAVTSIYTTLQRNSNILKRYYIVKYKEVI